MFALLQSPRLFVKMPSCVVANATTINAIIATSNSQILVNHDVMKKEEVATLDTLQDNITFIVNCSITPMHIEKPLWYMGCSNCFRTINAAAKQIFTCYNCPAQETQALPRAKVATLLRDKTGVIQATFFGLDAEKVIGCTAQNLANAIQEDDIIAMINIETQLNQKVQVRGSKYNSGGEMRRQFNASFLAIECEEVGESSASAALIELHNEVQKEQVVVSSANYQKKKKKLCLQLLLSLKM